jgi:RNA-binding protein
MSGLTAGKKRFVKRALGNARPTIWVGRDGASVELVKEVDKQLQKNEMVKVRILRSAMAEQEAKEVASGIAQETGSSLVEVRGHTFMLYRRRKK